MIRVHLIPETPTSGPIWSCAEIRLLRPYRHPSLQKQLIVSSGTRLPNDRVDVVVTQRAGIHGATLGESIELVRAIKRRGARLVHDLDDDLLSEHPVAEVERNISGGRPKLRFFLREADLVTVSTKPLAERVRVINPNVEIWENSLDETLIQPLKLDLPRRADIGYFGTTTHLHDLMASVTSIETAAKNEPGATIEICGISDDSRIANLFARNLQLTFRPVEVRYDKFHRMLAEGAAWRVGIAPLLSNRFNDSKSDIKALDYAAAGIATVASVCTAYSTLRHERNALIAPLHEFGQAIYRLLRNEDLRRSIVEQARNDLLNERVLAVRAPLLGSNLQLLLDAR